MTQFVNNTVTDIRRGHQSWRVFVAFCAPAFALTVFALTLNPFA